MLEFFPCFTLPLNFRNQVMRNRRDRTKETGRSVTALVSAGNWHEKIHCDNT